VQSSGSLLIPLAESAADLLCRGDFSRLSADSRDAVNRARPTPIRPQPSIGSKFPKARFLKELSLKRSAPPARVSSRPR